MLVSGDGLLLNGSRLATTEMWRRQNRAKILVPTGPNTKRLVELGPAGCDPWAMPQGAPSRSEDPSRAGSEILQGELEVVTYHSSESGYTVLRVNPEKGYGDPEDFIPGRVTAVGELETPAEGMRVRLEGGEQEARFSVEGGPGCFTWPLLSRR